VAWTYESRPVLRKSPLSSLCFTELVSNSVEFPDGLEPGAVQSEDQRSDPINCHRQMRGGHSGQFCRPNAPRTRVDLSHHRGTYQKSGSLMNGRGWGKDPSGSIGFLTRKSGNWGPKIDRRRKQDYDPQKRRENSSARWAGNINRSARVEEAITVKQ